MAVRANNMPSNNMIITRIANSAITKGQGVKLATDDDHVSPTGADDHDEIGVALNDAATGKRVQIQTIFCAIIPMTAGSGGVTRSKYVRRDASSKVVAVPAPGGGTVAHRIIGMAMESASADEEVGVGIFAAPVVGAT